MLISVWPTTYLQRPQHQWTHTLREPCSYLKVRSTQPDTSRYQFVKHFPLKEWCAAKSMQALDANLPLSKYATRRTQYLEKARPFKWCIATKALVFVIQSCSYHTHCTWVMYSVCGINKTKFNWREVARKRSLAEPDSHSFCSLWAGALKGLSHEN